MGATGERQVTGAAIPPSSHMRVDAARCSGCRDCQMVCSLTHEGQVAPSRARLLIHHDLFNEDHPRVLVCRQCREPDCLTACPRGAIVVHQTTGARTVDAAVCDGCGVCVQACEFGMIWVDEDAATARTCDLCEGDPQCVAFCPQKVLSYRKRRA